MTVKQLITTHRHTHTHTRAHMTGTFCLLLCASCADSVCVSVVVSSPVDGRLYLAYPHDSGALSQSFDELQLFDDGGADLVSVSTRSPGGAEGR